MMKNRGGDTGLSLLPEGPAAPDCRSFLDSNDTKHEAITPNNSFCSVDVGKFQSSTLRAVAEGKGWTQLLRHLT